MSEKRASIFADVPDLDVSGFKPRATEASRPPEEKAALRESGASLGFRSREPSTDHAPAVVASPVPSRASTPPKPRPVMTYDDRLSVRVRGGDKKRFD